MGPRYFRQAVPVVYEGVAHVATGANDAFTLSIKEILPESQFQIGLLQ